MIFYSFVLAELYFNFRLFFFLHKTLDRFFVVVIMTAYSLIAQSVERRTVNPQVAGSSPARGAKFKPSKQLFRRFSFCVMILLVSILCLEETFAKPSNFKILKK